MDYESKILLNRLVEEVEKLNEPDWWVIGITIVNAAFMAWLGWRQYKLQQKQTKQKKLYTSHFRQSRFQALVGYSRHDRR